jgi:hypothetical protein
MIHKLVSHNKVITFPTYILMILTCLHIARFTPLFFYLVILSSWFSLVCQVHFAKCTLPNCQFYIAESTFPSHQLHIVNVILRNCQVHLTLWTARNELQAAHNLKLERSPFNIQGTPFRTLFLFFDLMALWNFRQALSRFKVLSKWKFEHIEYKLKGFEFKFYVFYVSIFDAWCEIEAILIEWKFIQK